MTDEKTIGIASPGATGSAPGRAWAVVGHRAVATLDGRYARTRNNTGRLASATFRNEGGLIGRRLGFEESESVGWHIERGRAC